MLGELVEKTEGNPGLKEETIKLIWGKGHFEISVDMSSQQLDYGSRVYDNFFLENQI